MIDAIATDLNPLIGLTLQMVHLKLCSTVKKQVVIIIGCSNNVTVRYDEHTILGCR